MTRKTLTYSQRKDIDLYLGTVIKKFGEGFCEYLNGESDQTVATKFGCTVHNVQGVREAVYGRLRPAVAKFNAEEAVRRLDKRVESLERIIDQVVPDWRQPSLNLEAAE